MSSSFLSRRIKRTSDLLKVGASDQVLEYEERFRSLGSLYDRLLSDFIVSGFSFQGAYETSKEFFGSSKVQFAGVDGTMYSKPLFDLMVFFGGAYAATGTVEFRVDAEPTVEYDSKFMKEGAGVSSVVPIYINEVPDVDQTFFDLEEPGELSVSKPLVDETIINNATIASWIMTFSEYYLAYKLITDPERNIRLLLMDRALSAERASLLYDTSKRELWKAKASLVGYKVDGIPLDVNALAYGRYCIRNRSLGLPPARADYLRYAIIYLLEERESLSLSEMCKILGIKGKRRVRRVERYVEASLKEGYFKKKDSKYSIAPKYVDTWKRLKKLVRTLGDMFFFEEKGEEMSANRMKIRKDGKEHWLTTLDMAFLTLFCLYMIIEECWKRKILLIGLTKDTAARDFKRQLIPILQNEGMLRSSLTTEEFNELPNTDRMILQSVSLFNTEKVKVPWSLVEYDSCFKTMVADKKGRKGYVFGARRNRISLEKTFLKTYVQLSQAAKDPRLRSNVLLTDRLVHPEFDLSSGSVVKLWNEFGATKEPVEALLFKDKKVQNRLQNLVMVTLQSMTSSSIPEAFGHNRPLFIADKVAKWHYSAFSRIAESTREWILNNHKLRKFIFYMSTFRERRARIEAARREIS